MRLRSETKKINIFSGLQGKYTSPGFYLSLNNICYLFPFPEESGCSRQGTWPFPPVFGFREEKISAGFREEKISAGALFDGSLFH